MTITTEAPVTPPVEAPTQRSTAPRRRDLQRTFRLLLATVWLMDAALQLQPFMFTKGSNGFSGMLNGLAPGNPTWVSHTITWNASVVDHQPVLTNAAFVGIQFLIAFGIAWRRTVRPALVLSIVWSLGVWWFGEGLGGVLTGAATPLGGGPGAVLFYALLAVLLWPSDGPNEPFVAARTVGTNVARGMWATLWAGLAVLTVLGQGRSPQVLHDLVAKMDSGQPGWVARVDRWSESNLLHHGTTVAVVFSVFCLLVALSVYLRPSITQIVLSAAVLDFRFDLGHDRELRGHPRRRCDGPQLGTADDLAHRVVLAFDQSTDLRALLGERREPSPDKVGGLNVVGHPVGLYYLFGVLMLAVAAYCLCLLAIAARIRHAPGRDVELSHFAMGMAMAGMFVTAWAFGPDIVWELIFLGFLVLFIVRSFQSIGRFGPHVPHTAIHGLLSFAMLLMYWFPTRAASGAMSMSMGSGAHEWIRDWRWSSCSRCSPRPSSRSPLPTGGRPTTEPTAPVDAVPTRSQSRAGPRRVRSRR